MDEIPNAITITAEDADKALMTYQTLIDWGVLTQIYYTYFTGSPLTVLAEPPQLAVHLVSQLFENFGIKHEKIKVDKYMFLKNQQFINR